MKTMETLHSPKTGEKQNSQHRQRKNSANGCGNQQPTHIHEPTTHPISNVIAGELTQAKKGKEQTLNLYAREKDIANAKSGRNHRPHSVGTHSTQMILNTIAIELAQVEE